MNEVGLGSCPVTVLGVVGIGSAGSTTRLVS